VKSSGSKLRSFVALGLVCSLGAPAACKDTDPCDEGQESIGTGCFPQAAGGSSAGSSSRPDAGSPSDAGAADGGGGNAAPVGNPDATFGTPCETNAECGGDAPVCATDPLFYCTQLDCKDGEANAGACPDGYTCVLLPPNPSACVNLATAP
jgi:hypothetical protein